MFKTVLVANRGEIAVRIIRTCRDMGIKTVLPYAEPDTDSLAVALADTAVCIGPAALDQSYLNGHALLSLALACGAEAVHPGYGFLSENPDFARQVTAEGLIFIGPPAAVIEQMGDKIAARRTMRQAGVPVVPGSDGPTADLAAVEAVAREGGYPILLKAAAGGGGRGMRLVEAEEELAPAFEAACRESEAAFGDGRLYAEKYLTGAKHIEVQVACDRQGHCVHLGERDCSLQRRHQKVLEETPCRRLPEALRQTVCAAAVSAAQAVGYEGVGTVEFLVTPEGDWYFMEMNTRLQVEHPITEWVTGIDLVRAQLRLAEGLPLDWTQADIQLTGHAIECRINAQDPMAAFRPSVGKIESLHFPEGPFVRVDSALLPGETVSPFYDSLLAKVTVWGETRQMAIRRMRRALSEVIIEGVATTADFHFMTLHHRAFIRGEYTTQFLDDHLKELVDLL